MATAESPTGAIECIVVTPERTVLQTDADFVALPLYDGEMGIGRQHSPMIGRLGYGELRIRSAGNVDRYYVDGGFVQVADDTVAVLTTRALPADSVDTKAAAEHLESATKQVTSGDEEMAIRERHMAQARGQLRTAARNA